MPPNRSDNYKLVYALLFFLFIAAILVWSAVFYQSPTNLLKVHFFDVGQGSAVFIEAPDKNQVLIDGGPDDKIVSKLGRVMPFYDRTIDLVILTHPDADHLNGLIEVLKRYKVKEVLETGVADNSAAYQIWHGLIKQKQIPLKWAHYGEVVALASGVKMDILYPFDNLVGKSVKNSNETSIIGRLSYGKNSFLLTGDADNMAEQQLLMAGINIDSDVLEVAHHGSKSSTGDQFLAKVTPRIATIQVGKNNKFGHPHQEVLQKLKDILTLRTDINKDIKITSDGENINYY